MAWPVAYLPLELFCMILTANCDLIADSCQCLHFRCLTHFCWIKCVLVMLCTPMAGLGQVKTGWPDLQAGSDEWQSTTAASLSSRHLQPTPTCVSHAPRLHILCPCQESWLPCSLHIKTHCRAALQLMLRWPQQPLILHERFRQLHEAAWVVQVQVANLAAHSTAQRVTAKYDPGTPTHQAGTAVGVGRQAARG